MSEDADPEDDGMIPWVWRAVLEQHPEAVASNQFLGEPFSRQHVVRRWPRFVQTLGTTEVQALELVQMDATPLLVESEDCAEILGRLAAISDREKALELVGMNPSLLVGGRADKERDKGFGVSTLVDL